MKLFILFERRFCYTVQASLKCEILLSQPLKCWDYRHVAMNQESCKILRNVNLEEKKTQVHKIRVEFVRAGKTTPWVRALALGF